MQKTVRVFRDFASADAADREEYARMTPEERLRMLLTMRRWYGPADESAERLERVLRVTQFERR